MHGTGSDYYLTIYVEKTAIVSLRMEKGGTYDISETAIYSGYAEITAGHSRAGKLDSGDDLDQCLDGVWYYKNTDTAKNIIHEPLSRPTGGFKFEAARMTDRGYIQTLWYVGAPNKMYVRMYISTGWTQWFVYEGETVTNDQ